MTQEKRENFMFTNDTIFYKKLWSLMLPMMLQNLMLALVAVADAFMLGGMDQNYMSAVSLATQIQFIQNMLLSSVWHCGFVVWCRVHFSLPVSVFHSI